MCFTLAAITGQGNSQNEDEEEDDNPIDDRRTQSFNHLEPAFRRPRDDREVVDLGDWDEMMPMFMGVILIE